MRCDGRRWKEREIRKFVGGVNPCALACFGSWFLNGSQTAAIKNLSLLLMKSILSSIENIDMFDLEDNGWIFVENEKTSKESEEDEGKNVSESDEYVESKDEKTGEEENVPRPHVFVRIKDVTLKIYLITNATIGWVLSESIRQFLHQSNVEFSISVGISREHSQMTLDLSADVEILRSGETLFVVKCCLQASDIVLHLGPLSFIIFATY